MANLDPWTYADKTNKEQAHQRALFMWANMAARFGPVIANDPNSYNVRGFAQTQFENAGKLGYKIYSAPIPELKWLHAIHNQGHGDGIRGASARAEGVKAGVFDIMLPVRMVHPLGDLKSGLYIELKRPTHTNAKGKTVYAGKASPDQLKFKTFVEAQGYKAEVCVGFELAIESILCYLGLSKTKG